jgi:hypothetical protein
MDLNTITEIARPRQRAELPAWSAGDAWLAGGTWLFSEPQLKVSRLIDIADLGWLPLEPSEQGLRIAATCKIAELDGMAFPAAWIAAPWSTNAAVRFSLHSKSGTRRRSAAISVWRCRQAR